MKILKSCLIALGALALGHGMAAAQTAPAWPNGPVTIVVPYGTGGGTDSTARVLAKSLSEQLGVPVTVENHTGASGSIGAMYFLNNAKPDGQMLFVSLTGVLVNVPILNEVPYKYTDFKYIARIANSVDVLVASKDFPPNNPTEFVEYAKQNPDKLAMVYGGVGTQAWMGVQQMQKLIGFEIPLVPVPSGGGADQVAMVAGNHAQAGVISLPAVTPFLENGMVKAIGLMQQDRAPLLPDVPTFKEGGLDVLIGDDLMLMGRTDMPAETVAAIDAAVQKTFADPAFTTALNNIRLIPDYGNSEELTAIMKTRAEAAAGLLKDVAK